jgi:sucrose phosphorylase
VNQPSLAPCQAAPDSSLAQIAPLLRELFGTSCDHVWDGIVAAAEQHKALHGVTPRPPLDHTANLLITYADSLQAQGEKPLVTLRRVLTDLVGPAISHVHLLPVHPSTSDDGFAPVDYGLIDPRLGTWEDLAALGRDRSLMLDFVANHVSASSPWVRRWLAREPGFAHCFIERDPRFDTSATVRPRTSPLFHAFRRPDGTSVEAWTTFSADQLDLNFRDPDTFVRLTQALANYVALGARMIRLDAIGFVWKASGTSSMSLPQTHAVVRVWRAFLDDIAPGVKLVTETNVPAAENQSYFGDGANEANLVYQFPLPPLVLHSFLKADATTLSHWAHTVRPPGPNATFLNFLASHDGIGLRGVEGILDARELSSLVDGVVANGGLVSERKLANGRSAVYELNTTFLDALGGPGTEESPEQVAAKGLAAHAIMMALAGVPATYVHSLFGSSNDPAAAQRTGIKRRTSRGVLDSDRLGMELVTNPRRSTMFAGLRHLLSTRRRHDQFDPFTPHEVIDLGPALFAVRRASSRGGPDLICLTNVTPEPVTVNLPGRDLLTGAARSGAPWQVPGYGYVWLLQTRARP